MVKSLYEEAFDYSPGHLYCPNSVCLLARRLEFNKLKEIKEALEIFKLRMSNILNHLKTNANSIRIVSGDTIDIMTFTVKKSFKLDSTVADIPAVPIDVMSDYSDSESLDERTLNAPVIIQDAGLEEDPNEEAEVITIDDDNANNEQVFSLPNADYYPGVSEMSFHFKTTLFTITHVLNPQP